MKDKINKLEKILKMMIQNIIKKKNKIVYKIMKKIYDLKYRQLDYIPEKEIWISTVIFPTEIVDGICGVTDVFKGNKDKVNFEALYTVYIKKASESRDIHNTVVKCVRSGRTIQKI